MNAVGPPFDERRAMSPLAAAGWTLTLTFLLAALVQLTESVRPGAMGDVVSVTACHLLAHLSLLFVMLRLYAPAHSMRSVLGMRATSPLSIALAAVAGVGLYPAFSRLMEVLAQRFPVSPEEEELASKWLVANSLGGRVAVIVAFVLVIPLAEELFFRGLLYGALKRGRSTDLAVMVTSACATLAGAESRSLPTVLALALLLTWVRARSGSVVISAVLHVAFMAVPMVPIALGRDPNDDIVFPVSWWVGGLVAAAMALALLYVTTRSGTRAAAARMEDG